MTSSLIGARVAIPPSDGPEVCWFLERYCRETQGQNAGKTLQLLKWERDLFGELLILRPEGQRVYRQALIGLPRKNGKSSLCAGLGIYLLMGDGEPGAQVFSCAGDREQARIVFGTAKRMVELEPELGARLKLYRDAIEHPASGSVYRVVSAEAYTKEGLNPSGVIFDELHVQPNRELWDVMTLGVGTRLQPLVIAITTAGYDLDGTICGELYRYGKRVQSGEIADPTFFFRWWEPSRADCDWRDEAVWYEANPSLGHFLHLEALRDAANKKPENIFRRYHLNQWTATAEAWLPFGAWDACRSDLELDPGLPLHVGIDVALRNDSTAIVCAQKHGERTVVRAFVWENPFPEGSEQHDAWTLNPFEVERMLRELRQTYPAPTALLNGQLLPGPEFLFDPAFFFRSAEVLAGEGLAMVEYPQHDSRMVPASQALYQLVVEGKIAHSGDPALARQVGNVVADQRPRGGWRISKPRGSRKKIDAAVALAIAAYRAQFVTQESVYESRGMVLL